MRDGDRDGGREKGIERLIAEAFSGGWFFSLGSQMFSGLSVAFSRPSNVFRPL
jgi:hypothetical protein